MEKIYDVLIIGSGPAGLGAAIYAARAGLLVAVIEKSSISGGQVLSTYEVDNYLGFPGISGMELSKKFREHADYLKIPFIEAEVLAIETEQKIKKIETSAGEFLAKTIIAATGAYHAKLNVKGEEELSGMGVSYCATCDGAFFKNRTVAVAGGGDVAVEDAIYLSNLCKKVYLIHRRDELRAAKSLQKQLLDKENVECLFSKTVQEIKGEDMVTGVRLLNLKTNEEEEKEIDGIFIAVGIIPQTELFRNIFETDDKGYALTGEDCRTSVAGIYAVGDIRKKPLHQIITAVADGANAICSALEYIQKDIM